MTIFVPPQGDVLDVDLPAPLARAEDAEPTPDAGSARRRRATEMAVVAAALLTNLWSLSVNGWGNPYYAAAVRSMTGSWSNFFFAAYDPGGWLTVDKPPLAFWVPALSARVFGFSSWSILAPSAVAGALAVWMLIVTVRRVWGHTAGIVAGIALATMPTAVAVSRSNNPDVWLVLGIVAAAWALDRAVATDRLRWLAWMGVFVGVGFLAKLGAALIVVPALWGAYLVAARAPFRRRIGGLAVASAAATVVALIWIGAAAVIPASSRPYIGGSTDGTAWDLVTGYNGLGRLTGSGTGGGPGGGRLPGGGGFPGGPSSGGLPGLPGGFGGGSGVNAFGGTPGIGRLFNAGMGDQVLWLVAPALAALLGATWLLARRRLRRTERGSLVAWAGWALTTFVAFSYASGIYHNYYVAQLAPAVAALTGIGASLVLRGGRVARLIAAASLLVTAVVQVVFMRRVEALHPLRIVVLVALVIGATVLASQARSTPSRRASFVGIGIAAGAAMIAPAAWSISSLGHAGSGTFPEARPVATEVFGAPGAGGAASRGPIPGGGGFPGGAGLDEAELTWLRGQRTTEKWLIAVDSSMQASDAIIHGDSVMAIGGFSGGDPTMSTRRLAELVRNGDLRFVSAGGGGGFGGFGGGSSIASTVSSVCAEVPSSNWGGSDASTVYDCSGLADEIAASTPESNRSPAPGDAGTPGSDRNPAPGALGTGPAGVDIQALQECMSDKGFDLGGGPPSLDPETLAALQDCGFDPTAFGGPPGTRP